MKGIYTKEDLREAISLMKLSGTDLFEYELKSAAGGFPKSAVQTVCAFANASGGSMIFGISEKTFEPYAELDVKLIQQACADIARNQIVPAVNADIHVIEYLGKPVVAMNVEEMPKREKPCYIRKSGMMNGSYIRVGDGNHKLNHYELNRFVENQQMSVNHDSEMIPDSSFNDLDMPGVQKYLETVRKNSLGRLDHVSDDELLENSRILIKDEAGSLRCTIAGMLAFGKFPQKYLPRFNLVFTAYPGTSKGIPGEGGLRFLDSATLDGTIGEIVPAALSVIFRNVPARSVMRGPYRQVVYSFSEAAVREVLINALIHRDYSKDSFGAPVEVNLFSDRLEIVNPGGLYGNLQADQLGKDSRTISRNPFLARIMENVPYPDRKGFSGYMIENRGSGYPTIFYELEKEKMERPIILSSLNEFRIVFLKKDDYSQEYALMLKDEKSELSLLDIFRTGKRFSFRQILQVTGLSERCISENLIKLLYKGRIAVDEQHSDDIRPQECCQTSLQAKDPAPQEAEPASFGTEVTYRIAL